MENKFSDHLQNRSAYLSNSINNDNNNHSIEKLLKLPVENLVERIKEIENDIIERFQIRTRIFSDLEHERRKLEDMINQLEYNRFNPAFLSRKTGLESQMLSVEQGKLHEHVACFRDVVMLKEKLRFAKEELKKQKEKFNLLKNERNKRTT